MTEALNNLDKLIPSKVYGKAIISNSTKSAIQRKKHPVASKCHSCERKLCFEVKYKKKNSSDEIKEDVFNYGYKLELCVCSFCSEYFCNYQLLSLKTRGK